MITQQKAIDLIMKSGTLKPITQSLSTREKHYRNENDNKDSFYFHNKIENKKKDCEH